MLFAVATTDPINPDYEFTWAMVRGGVALACLVVAILLGASASAKKAAPARRVRCAAWAWAWFLVFGMQVMVVTKTGDHIERWEMIVVELALGVAFLIGEIAGAVSRYYHSGCLTTALTTKVVAKTPPPADKPKQLAAVA